MNIASGTAAWHIHPVMAAARTAAEFDKWYSSSGGDPWNYQSRSIVLRLNRSLEFVREFLPSDYSYPIWEVACFRGDFTRLLRDTYPRAKIKAVEISEFAIASAREKVPGVEFQQGDFLNIAPPSADIVFALECIYYLLPEERAAGLANIVKNKPSQVFISSIVTGGKYLTESWLREQMEKHDYRLVARRVLNFRFRILNLISYAFPAILKLNITFANQVIYAFQR